MYSEAAQPSFRDIVPEDAVVEQVSTGHLFTEGPVWDPREGALLWVDITGDTIWKWIPGVGRSVFLSPSGKSNGLTFDRQGRLVAAGWSSRRIWRREHDGSIIPLATHHQGVRIGVPNDIVVRSDGSIYWTDSVSGLRAPGFETDEDLQIYRPGVALFRVVPETGEVTMVTDEVPGANGLAFSPDESLLYVNDSRCRGHVPRAHRGPGAHDQPVLGRRRPEDSLHHGRRVGLPDPAAGPGLPRVRPRPGAGVNPAQAKDNGTGGGKSRELAV
jgi:gluconolactonase